MPIEIKGTRVRARVAPPKKFKLIRTHDIGSPGHTQRVSGVLKKDYITGLPLEKQKWTTQAWTFPIIDVRERRYQTVKILKTLGVFKKASRLVKKR